VMHEVQENDIPRKIFASQPDLILNFDNEFMSFSMMDALNEFYDNSTAHRPQRHYFNKFIKDLRHWNLKQFDFMHYSIPQVTAIADGFRFPGLYSGQYGVYDAISHLFSKHKPSAQYLRDGSVLLSKKGFAGQTEAAVEYQREQFR